MTNDTYLVELCHTTNVRWAKALEERPNDIGLQLAWHNLRSAMSAMNAAYHNPNTYNDAECTNTDADGSQAERNLGRP